MNIRLLFLAFSLAFAVIARPADEPLISHEPDHLLPVDPYPTINRVSRYSDHIRARFKLARLCYLRMLVEPSFSAEYVVRLQGDEKIPGDISTAEKLVLSYSIGDKSVWYSMPENNRQKKQQKVTISTTSTDFPKALGARVGKVWQRMLRRTQYSEEASDGLDGTTYEFTFWGMVGATWSPQERKSPLLLIELGDSLIGYCKAAPAERPAVAMTIEAKAAQLEQYLDEHPSK